MLVFYVRKVGYGTRYPLFRCLWSDHIKVFAEAEGIIVSFHRMGRSIQRRRYSASGVREPAEISITVLFFGRSARFPPHRLFVSLYLFPRCGFQVRSMRQLEGLLTSSAAWRVFSSDVKRRRFRPSRRHRTYSNTIGLRVLPLPR